MDALNGNPSYQANRPNRWLHVALYLLLIITMTAAIVQTACAQTVTKPDVTVLTQRIEKLEGQNKILMFGGIMIIIALVLQGAMRSLSGHQPKTTTSTPYPASSSEPKIMATVPIEPVEEETGFAETESELVPIASFDELNVRRVIISDDGNTRAEFGVSDEGETVLRILGTDQQPRIQLIVDAQDVPTISLLDAEQNERLYLTIGPDGTSSVTINDQAGLRKAELAVDPDDCPCFDLYDGEGIARAEISVDSDGDPGIGLYSADEKASASMTVDAESRPSIVLTDKDGAPIWNAPG